jgi:hypothetical protein
MSSSSEDSEGTKDSTAAKDGSGGGVAESEHQEGKRLGDVNPAEKAPAKKALADAEDSPIPKKKQKANNNGEGRDSLGQGYPEEEQPEAPVAQDSDNDSIVEGETKELMHVRGVSRDQPPPIMYKAATRYGAAGVALANALDECIWFYEQTSIGGKVAGAMRALATDIQRGKLKKLEFLQIATNQIAKMISPLYMWQLVKEEKKKYDIMQHCATFPVVVVLPQSEKFNGFCVANGWIFDARKDTAIALNKENLMDLGYYIKNDSVATQDQVVEQVKDLKHYAVVMNHDWVKPLLVKNAEHKDRNASGFHQYGTSVATAPQVDITHVSSNNTASHNIPNGYNRDHSNRESSWGNSKRKGH